MSDAYDHEFQPLVAKAAYLPERPTSRLSVISLVFGILGLTVLPLIGSIVAIATGHAALGQIRESGGRLDGRPLAKVGLGLGYFYLVLALLAGVILLYAFALRSQSATETVEVKVATPAPAEPEERGVKMVNEMNQADHNLIEGRNLNNAEGEIIACYNAGKGASNPELALLTTRQLIYLKDGRTTSFNLKDVAEIKDDNAYQRVYTPYNVDSANYYIEVMTKQGPRMRIIIQPKLQGSSFYEAIAGALKQAGVTVPTP